jgi:hypothetical protein
MQQLILRDRTVALCDGRHILEPTLELLCCAVGHRLMYSLAQRTEVHVCAEVGTARVVQQLHELVLADRLVQATQ